MYPDILVCSSLVLSETEGAPLETARFEPTLGIELLSSCRAGRGCVFDVLDDALDDDDEADPPLTRPIPIVLVKCWKVAHCNAKKLLKNCQKSKKLLPKFQKLLPKFLAIFI